MFWIIDSWTFPLSLSSNNAKFSFETNTAINSSPFDCVGSNSHILAALQQAICDLKLIPLWCYQIAVAANSHRTPLGLLSLAAGEREFPPRKFWKRWCCLSAFWGTWDLFFVLEAHRPAGPLLGCQSPTLDTNYRSRVGGSALNPSLPGPGLKGKASMSSSFVFSFSTDNEMGRCEIILCIS